jgi:hypothetical protein
VLFRQENAQHILQEEGGNNGRYGRKE